jgi:NAD(P)-dependent dehydrogenase (short-subunit alcohol dehydrogenase family)
MSVARDRWQMPTALVTGGASGIGRALAMALSESGAAVFVADRQTALAEHVVCDITRGGGRAYVADLDVRNRTQFEGIVQSIVESTGRLDYLFNNAGIGVLGQASHFTHADWSDVLDVNLTGVCNGVAAAYPQMVEQRCGHIVNTASLAGLVPAPLIASYTASKFGVVGLSRALRVEAARHHVRVSVLCPFIVDTPLLGGGFYGRIHDDTQSLEKGRRFLRALAVSPQRLARRVLQQVGRNRAIIVYPGWARLLWHLDRLTPWVSERLAALLLNRWMD